MAVSEICYCFTDIETETLRGDRLLQIASVTDQNEQFCIFINPQQELLLSCTNLLGLYMFKGQLYRNGKFIPSVTIKRALLLFSDWLKSRNKSIVLVCHNGFGFDFTVIAKYFIKFNIPIPENILKVCDTLPSFRKQLKDISNHKLSTLAKHFEISHSFAHDALSDSIALKEICLKHVAVSKTTLQEFLDNYQKNFNFYLDREKERLKLKLNGKA